MKHCKQQSRNHISLKMVLVVLMFKHEVIPLHWAVWHRVTVSSHFLIQTLLSAESKIKAVFAWAKRANKREPTQNDCSHWFQTHRCARWKAIVYSKPQKKAGTHFALLGIEGHAMMQWRKQHWSAVGSCCPRQDQDGLFTMEHTTVHVFAG